MATGGYSVQGQVVCVTGAGGYIASWLVKHLLESGYSVKGTVRNPDDSNNFHLKGLEGANERLVLCKADLLNYDSLRSAIDGCNGVFHTASPVTNDPDEVSAAVDGTKNVINAAAESGVRRIVFTSSIGAVHMNPNRSTEAIIDESCWSDLEFCMNTNNWYCYAKMVAELSAMELARKRGLDLVVVVPPLTMGPMLQSKKINVSMFRLLTYITGSKKTYPNAVQAFVDVRDLARAHVLVYETPSAWGRYFCIESVLHRSDVVDILEKLLPAGYPITNKCEDEVNPRVKPFKFSNQRLKDLGLQYIPITQSIYDTVKCLQEKGHLPLPQSLPPSSNHRSSL